MIIDSHQHFWNYSPETHDWIDDTMSVLKSDFLPQQLNLVFEENAIDGCIAVQASQTEAETEFLHELSIQHDFIKAVVGWTDLSATDIEKHLDKYSSYQKIAGFRHIVQSEPDPNFMLRPAFTSGITALKTYDYTYDILIFPHQLEAASTLVRQFPNQKFVVDHLAKPLIKAGEIDSWKKSMSTLAESENVSCKLSGMVTEANWTEWTYDDFVPYLDVILDAFGPNRLMYGSDWPVCLLAASYKHMKDIVTTYISKLSQAEIENIMGLHALDFYNITN